MKFKVFDIDTGKWSDPFVLEDVITGDADIEWDGGESTLPWEDFIFFRKEFGELTIDEPAADYWKQRCESAEEVIEVERLRGSYERRGSRVEIEAAYKKWLSIKDKQL